MSHLKAIAERINTGSDDPLTSRALVVFNLTDHTLSGTAAFPAEISWPAAAPIPPVVVQTMDGHAVPSATAEWHEEPDRKGRYDRRWLTFTLRFAVRDVPPQGWRTYIAAYADAPGPDAVSMSHDVTPGLTVVETLRHTGDYPPTGTWLTLNPLLDRGEGGEPRGAR